MIETSPPNLSSIVEITRVKNRRYAWIAGLCAAASIAMLILSPSAAAEPVGESAAQGSGGSPFGFLSILPPLLAIAVALLSRRAVPALFFGVWVGAWALTESPLAGAWLGLLDAFEVFVRNAIADEGRVAIILFSFMIGGMVGILSRNGGMLGIVSKVSRWATDAGRGQVATAVLGLIVFFDDYANTLVVGNTMRSVTDKLRISREKLAYVVDSTAAPVSCVAFVTTWIGYEVGLIDGSLEQMEGIDLSGYAVFLSSIPFSFYPILAILFVFLVATQRRDFGPMKLAERRARTTGEVLGPEAHVDEEAASGEAMSAKEGIPHRALNAVIPIVVLVVTVLVGLYVTGDGTTVREIVGSADSHKALMWASLLGATAAGALSMGQRILTLSETVDAWYGGVKAMLFAMIILVLAWSLSDITAAMGTADYLVSVLGETLPPALVPAVVFILAAATAFATGTSWGTMGILMPITLPLAWAIMSANGVAEPSHYHILYSSVACILAGAVWGDHCSPISDTTILSSMASGCDHVEHVRTQMPYALTVGFVGLILGTIPTGYGLPAWISMVIGGIVLWLILRRFGEPVDSIGEPS